MNRNNLINVESRSLSAPTTKEKACTETPDIITEYLLRLGDDLTGDFDTAWLVPRQPTQSPTERLFWSMQKSKD